MRDFTPRPYQPPAMHHLLDNERSALWARMGMGKSSTTLAVLDVLHNLLGEDGPTLIAAPKRVARDTWPDEQRKWRQFSALGITSLADGTPDERLKLLKRDTPVFTINYEMLPWLVEHFGDKWPFTTIVADESRKLSAFRLKQGGVQAASLGRIAHKKVGGRPLVKRFIQLTGAPAPNGLAGLWGQAWFLDAGERLGRTFDSFRQRWFQKSFDGYSIDPLPFAQEQIQDKLRDLCFTLDPKDWFDLREPIRSTVYVELPARARQKYRDMEREMFASIDGHEIEAFSAAARTMKCLQLANGAFYGEVPKYPEGTWFTLHEEKLEALESVMSEAGGMPVLCAYHFVSDRERILRTFPKAVDLATRDGMAAFKAGKSPLGIGHPASIGHGVDGLQDVTNIVAFFGHWWDLDQREQFIERVGPTRQAQAGHDRPVFIYDIVARDTVDDLVLVRHETKASVQQLLLDAMKQKGLR